MSEFLIERVIALRDMAVKRGSVQGVKIYEAALLQMDSAKTKEDADLVVAKLKRALIGVETHGFFPPDEYKVVKVILDY